jgi:hypothetical protein
MSFTPDNKKTGFTPKDLQGTFQVPDWHSGCWENDIVTGTATIVIPPPTPPPAAGGRQPAGPITTPSLAKIVIKGTFARDCHCRITDNNINFPQPYKDRLTTVSNCKDSQGTRDFTFHNSKYKGYCNELHPCIGNWNEEFDLEISASQIALTPPFGSGKGQRATSPPVDPPQWAKDCGVEDGLEEYEDIDFPLWVWTGPIAAACALKHIKCTDAGQHQTPPTNTDPYPSTPGDVLAKIIDVYLKGVGSSYMQEAGVGSCVGQTSGWITSSSPRPG